MQQPTSPTILRSSDSKSLYSLRIKNKLVFRIRIIEKSGKDPIAIVALKGNAVLVDGIAHVEEVRCL